MVSKKELLKFEEISNVGKTKRFNVFSNNSGDFLGEIKWDSGWRCYVTCYADGIRMSASCEIECANFKNNLESERKKELQKVKDEHKL
jgi:hypothetical protein